MMFNLLLFLGSCACVAGFACYFRHLGQSALTAWIAILSLLANLFVLKQITLLGFNATASDIFAIGSLLGLNMLQDKYGALAAKHAIKVSFCCIGFFILMSQIHLLYQPSSFDHTQEAFLLLLNPAPRILFASIITFFIVQRCDIQLYQYLRQLLPKIETTWTSALSMAISQLLDTVLFSLLGLYGIVDAIIEIIFISYAIKIIAIANTIPWSFAGKRILSK